MYELSNRDLSPRFHGHGAIFMPIDALSVFCAQLTRDLLAIAKFFFNCFMEDAVLCSLRLGAV